ncbi:MAG: tetratricopeptide repeat protein [Bacteroidetes bacterium]|nr:MAG: tetratricopeptide repeat protein [Bacteroidota bacterium]
MDNSKKFTDDNLQGEELEAFTEKFLRAKFDRDRKKRWGKILEEKHGINPPGTEPRRRKGRTIYLWMGAVAAAVVLLFLAYPLFFNASENNYQQLADNYIQEEFFQNQEISKGDQDIETLEINAATAYNNKAFETAIENYDKIVEAGAAEDRHIFFLGLSHLYQGNYQQAIETLSGFVENEDFNSFQLEASWFLALAYIKHNEPEKAKPFLEEIQKGSWNRQKAQNLLDLLE